MFRCLGDSQISPLPHVAQLLPVVLSLPYLGPRRSENFRLLPSAAAMTLECTPSSTPISRPKEVWGDKKAFNDLESAGN